MKPGTDLLREAATTVTKPFPPRERSRATQQISDRGLQIAECNCFNESRRSRVSPLVVADAPVGRILSPLTATSASGAGRWTVFDSLGCKPIFESSHASKGLKTCGSASSLSQRTLCRYRASRASGREGISRTVNSMALSMGTLTTPLDLSIQRQDLMTSVC